MNDGSAPSKAGIAKGQVLYTLAAENGDTETAMKLAGDLARIATEAGQNLQAQRLLKRMTPEGKLYYAQQTLESFKKELVDQYGSQFGNISIPGELADALMKAGSQKEQDEALLAQQTLESFKKELVDQYGSQFGNISIPGELADALMKAGSQKEQDEALLAIYRNIADQLPATWADRWNAWRYLAMLANPATHIRNVASNVINIPVRSIYRNIADQLPATWADRWNAWRYLAMLANPATHIRNVASNVINIPVRRLKNLIGAALEPTFVPAGQRTKSVLNPLDSADRALKEFARQDLDNVAAILDGSQKYNDRQIIEQLKDPFKVNGSWGTAASSPLPQRIARKAADTAAGAASRLYKANSGIEQLKDPFKVNGSWGTAASSPLPQRIARKAADTAAGAASRLYKANSGALSAEDTLFKKTAYTDSLAQYLKANRIDPKTAEGAVLDKARAYAIEEAKRATYTEANSLAQALGRFERTNLGTKLFVGGLVPFKDKARAYAIEEAKRATYTEANSLAQALGRFERTNLGTKLFVGGLVPFNTTPLNIIKRGLAYSPAGLVKAMTLDTALMRMGRMSAAEMIDNLAQGLTGTGIMALGAFLASQGLVNGVSPENKKERDFKAAGGWQDYSINLPGGGTYTIDWAGPAVMALLAGVEAFHASEQEGFGFNEFLTAMGNITEPLFDTTMLSGINSAIQSATYAGSNPVTAAAGQAVSNFATQGIPTLSGQLARAMDPVRRTPYSDRATYAGSNPVTAAAGQAVSNFATQGIPTLSGQLARAMDPVRRTPYSDRQGAEGGLWEAAQRITSRIPGLSAQNPPYVDVWGRTQENPGGSTLGRLAYGMLSPGYYSPDRTTDADRLVEQIYGTTRDAAALPALLNSSFTMNGEKVVLDAQQFTRGKQVKGQTSADMVEALEGYAPFEALEPAGQAAVLEGVYSLANTMAKTQVIPQLEEDFQTAVNSGDLTATEAMMQAYLDGGADAVIPYLVAKEIAGDVTGDKNSFQTAVNSGDLTATEAMMQAYLDGGADAVIPYLVAKEIAGDVTGDKNSAGKTIPGSKKQNTLEALMDAGYSRAQAERIYGVIG